MIDATLRRVIDPPLNAAGKRLAARGIKANHITTAGFLVGIMTIPLLAAEQYGAALAAISLNRLADGLDGAVARSAGATEFGGYWDIVADFVFYSAVVFGMVLARPDQAVYGAFLIFSFIGSGASFLTYAIFAQKHGITTSVRGQKSIYYLGGLAEGFETIVALVLMCLFPNAFWLIATGFGIMCWITTATRVAWAYQTLPATERGH